MINKLADIDRRYIFVLIFISLAIPTIYPFDMPIEPSKEVRAIHEKIESLPPGSPVLLSMDYDPSSKPELYPMTIALLRHMFAKDLHVLGMTHWPAGRDLAKGAIQSVAKEMGKVEGEDYVYFGYAAGGISLIINMGQDLYSAFPADSRGVATKEIPMLKKVKSLKELSYAVTLAAGSTVEWWIVYGAEKYGFEMGAGCTAVIAPDLYPFLQAGQVNGLLGGIKGAWEYEALIKKRGDAYKAVPAQSSVHAVVILLIILCNIGYFYSRRRR